MTHKLENNYTTKVLPQEWKSWAPWEASQLRSLDIGGAPDNLALKTNGVWLQEFQRIEKNRNSTLGGHTENLTHTRTQWKKQLPHKRRGQTYLLVLESFLLWWRVAVVHCRYKDRGNSRKLLETRKLWMEKLTGKGKHTVNVGYHPQINVISKPAILRKVQM